MSDGEMITAGHLGGYVQGGDPATWYPDLWRWLVTEKHVDSVLDVGCGEGLAVEFFHEQGCRAFGIDGMPQGKPYVLEHDFTRGPVLADSYDLVWSCEFVEHVEEQFIPNFIGAMCAAPLVLMTHAQPGQPGYHHVNCQPSSYWQGLMAGHGYRLDMDLTRETQVHAAKNPSPWNHYLRSGLAFVRT